jgi:predicted permease
MERLIHDLRFGLRGLRRTPAFTAIALLTLAIGIGANTAIFSVVNSVILRPLGYPQPGQLMYLSTQFTSLGFPSFWVSPPEYMEFRTINRSFAAVGAFATGEANLTAGAQPVRVRSALVDEHLLKALGVPAAHGRLFGPGDTTVTGPPPTPGQPPLIPPTLAILSHELWQRAFGGRPMVGELVEVDGRRREIIGIMPPGADVMDNRTEIWLPLGLNEANRQNRGNHYLYLIGRLKDGVGVEAARSELGDLLRSWGERIGLPPGSRAHLYTPAGTRDAHFLQMTPLQDQMLGTAARSIWLLQAAVGLVLLIACANLANLFLARAESRHREFAIRSAIGATQARLLRQFVTEGVLLAVVGGVLGVSLARVGVAAMLRAFPNSLPRTAEVTIDSTVLWFTLGLSVVTGVLFGVAPLLHTRVAGLAAALKDSGAKGVSTGTRHHVRRALVAVEVALAVTIVIGAGLLVRTVSNLAAVDGGFDRARLVTFSMTLPPVRYPAPAQRAQAYQRVLEDLRALPGVQSATAMSGLPPDRPLNANDTDIEGYTAPPEGPFENVDYYQSVYSNYFETLGIPLIHGRSFQSTDAASSGPVAIVNETLANTFWKGADPIGKRLRPCCSDQIPWFTVVGVAKDVKQGGVDRRAGTEFYVYVDQAARLPPPVTNAPPTMNIVLRTTQPAAALAAGVEQTLAKVDATVPVVRLREMQAVYDEAIRRPRLLAQLFAAFGFLALLLAAIGTYGVLSYTVTEQRRDIGIRLALGAARGRVVTGVMRQGLLPASIGLAIGVAAAFGMTRLIASLLFAVEPTDPTTFIAVVATIAAAAIAACGFPAWRAARLDPNVVLRDE